MHFNFYFSLKHYIQNEVCPPTTLPVPFPIPLSFVSTPLLLPLKAKGYPRDIHQTWHNKGQ